jgi:hypothetical protein
MLCGVCYCLSDLCLCELPLLLLRGGLLELATHYLGQVERTLIPVTSYRVTRSPTNVLAVSHAAKNRKPLTLKDQLSKQELPLNQITTDKNN